ncbi:MAG: hypothetical protein ACRDKW_07710 [Actinomycetota bacterium]
MVRRLLLVALALLLGFPAVAPAAENPPVQELLDTRAEAVRSRDRAAFLATVDTSDRAFADAQAAWFDRLAPVPLADYRLTLDEGDLTRERDLTRWGSTALVAPVEETVQFEGYGDPVADVVFLTFVRTRGRWRISSDTGVADLGLESSRHPWDYGPVSVRRSEHFLLLYHPDEEDHADELLAQAEQAVPEVGKVWLRPWDMRIPLQVPSSPEELEGYLGGGLDVSKFVAFALSSYDPENEWKWGGSRVVLNPGNFLGQPPAVRQSILVHELLHVAAEGATGPYAMVFVEEGIAELAAGDPATPQLDRQVRTGVFNRRLPENHEFVAGTQEEVQVAYQKAASAFAFMEDRNGLDGVNRFFEAYRSTRVVGGSARYHLDQAFRRTLGIGLDEFQAEWAQTLAPVN